MFDQASKKLGLDQAVLHDMRTSSLTSAQQPKSLLDKKEIDILLKFGAYELFKDEDEKEKKFHEEGIPLFTW